MSGEKEGYYQDELNSNICDAFLVKEQLRVLIDTIISLRF